MTTVKIRHQPYKVFSRTTIILENNIVSLNQYPEWKQTFSYQWLQTKYTL